MKTFDELWREVQERSQRWAIPVVQNRAELEHVFNLMKGCKQYLEVGSAEGNSLYVLSHALADESFITVIDFGEKHTQESRAEVATLMDVKRYHEVLGNSHSTYVIKAQKWPCYDAVMIDAGHTYEDVIADAIAYGHLATKYIFFHDIQLPSVKAAFEWYCRQNPQFKVSTFINSETYGYGIIEI